MLGLIGKGSKTNQFSQRDLRSWVGDAKRYSCASGALALSKDIVDASFRGKGVLGIELQRKRVLLSRAAKQDMAVVMGM